MTRVAPNVPGIQFSHSGISYCSCINYTMAAVDVVACVLAARAHAPAYTASGVHDCAPMRPSGQPHVMLIPGTQELAGAPLHAARDIRINTDGK